MLLDPLTLKLLIKDIPLLSKTPLSEITIKELNGFTNNNYLIIAGDQKTILRIPRQSSNKNINRENEAHNAEIAHQLGLAPEILWREKEGYIYTGMSVVAVVEDAQPLIKNDFKNTKIQDEIASSLVILQNSQQLFKGRLSEKDIAQYLKNYFSLCARNQQKSLEKELSDSLKLLANIKNDHSPVCSHNDLVAENFLKLENRICLIDWEYSAMASPFWDIATIVNAGEFNKEEAQLFLAKLMPNYTKADIECLKQYRSIVSTVSHFWHLAYADS